MDVEHWRALIRELRGIEIIDLMRVRVEQVEDIELQVPKTADVQHLADHVIAERGVRYGRVVMIPTSPDKRPKSRKHGHHHD
jgi:CopG family transcriptional regulator, nickel-responsive regulator